MHAGYQGSQAAGSVTWAKSLLAL